MGDLHDLLVSARATHQDDVLWGAGLAARTHASGWTDPFDRLDGTIASLKQPTRFGTSVSVPFVRYGGLVTDEQAGWFDLDGQDSLARLVRMVPDPHVVTILRHGQFTGSARDLLPASPDEQVRQIVRARLADRLAGPTVSGSAWERNDRWTGHRAIALAIRWRRWLDPDDREACMARHRGDAIDAAALLPVGSPQLNDPTRWITLSHQASSRRFREVTTIERLYRQCSPRQARRWANDLTRASPAVQYILLGRPDATPTERIAGLRAIADISLEQYHPACRIERHDLAAIRSIGKRIRALQSFRLTDPTVAALMPPAREVGALLLPGLTDPNERVSITKLVETLRAGQERAGPTQLAGENEEAEAGGPATLLDLPAARARMAEWTRRFGEAIPDPDERAAGLILACRLTSPLVDRFAAPTGPHEQAVRRLVCRALGRVGLDREARLLEGVA